MAVFGGSAGRQGLVPSDLLVLSLSPAGTHGNLSLVALGER
jgi:hypothetical protein